ncbi:retrovirus-related pol polyprotein from transposon TNT 1-94 [Tanacetum coccineum]|uniref:Retrovirus-related pol polyprotein from transposon TNT 1-94 n=1 Tax=Tanacetum coccineum TaxID=301880 RepID=A0ABQ5A4U7_9ASTR
MAKQCTARKKLQAIANFKADHVDVYDSNCNAEAIVNAIFMENLSPVGSLSDDTVSPRYDSDTLSKVPHYDTYHDSDVLNSNIQELGYIENIVSTNESYDDLKGNHDVISYTDYMLTIGDDAVTMFLLLYKRMKSQVEKCNKVNQESKSKIESLTSELERYKDRVRVLGYVVKDGHSEQEAYLNHELYTIINDRNRKVKDFEKQVFSQETQIKDLNTHIAFLKKNFETLKHESSERYEKNITEILDLEKAKKELEVPPVTVSNPKVFPKKLPSTSQVLRNLNNARDLLTKLDECIKRRTTLSPHEIGLGYNLFSVGELCDSDLEVAFRKHTCFVWNLEGVDLLSGSRGSNLYTILMADMMKSSPICLLSKASKTKSWLWHRRLSHLNFCTINQLAKQGLVKRLPKLKYTKDHLCSPCQMGKSKKESHPHKPKPSTNEKLQMLHMDLCRPMQVESINKKRYILFIVDDYSHFTWVKFLRMKDQALEIIIKFLKQAQVSLNATVRYLRTDNGTEFLNQTLRNYTEEVRITHNTSTARTPQQNGVVERRNCTLVEAARTMFIFYKSLLFLWAEAVDTTCYTQNRSLIHTRYDKTLYELLKNRKQELKCLYVFGALCYPTNNFENLGKLQPKADIRIFIGLVLNQVASTSAKPPIKNDWDLLFQPMFDEYSKNPSDASNLISAVTLPPPNTAGTSSSSSTSIDKDAPSPSTSPNNKTSSILISSINVETNEEVAMFDSDTFTNPFSPPETSSAESSSKIVDTSNMHTFQQPPRRQLSTNTLWCYFHAFLAKEELKNYKESMEESCWIKAMQEKINEF